MLMQYSVVNKCLQELKNYDMPMVDKLKLEIELIQLKRVLLNEKVEAIVRKFAPDDRTFNDLYYDFKHEWTFYNKKSIDKQIRNIKSIKEALLFQLEGVGNSTGVGADPRKQ